MLMGGDGVCVGRVAFASPCELAGGLAGEEGRKRAWLTFSS